MRKSCNAILVCMLAVLTATVFALPQTAYASGTKNKPTADKVTYYEKTENGRQVKTGIKTIKLNPYTFFNIGRDTDINPGAGDEKTTLEMNKALMRKIAEKEIFPKWGVIAEGIFRDQASQLVTIEGTGMMSSSTSAKESFDRHFSYGKSGVSGGYKSENWALSDLADTLGRPSRDGKNDAELTEFKLVKGETNNDEVVYSGIYPINNLKDARTLMGKGLRACADDNDLTVDDFLGNGNDKTSDEYRLPDLDNDKTESGFCNVVTCVNRAGGSQEYDYVTFGLAVYDFSVTPIAAKNLEYIEAADAARKSSDAEDEERDPLDIAARQGVEGVYYKSDGIAKTTFALRNNSDTESTVTTTLENSETDEVSTTTEDSFEWGMEQELGVDVNIGTCLEGAVPRTTLHMQNNWHETWSTMNGKTESKAKTWTKNISTEVELPPHTAALVKQSNGAVSEGENYQQPVIISYKVAIFAMSGDYHNGAKGYISNSSYDKQWMSVLFDGSDGYNPGGSSALSSLYTRACVDNIDGYDGVYGKYRSYCDKSAWKNSSTINWDSIASGISADNRSSHSIARKTGDGKCTLKDLATEVPFAESATVYNRDRSMLNTEVEKILPLYDLDSVYAEKNEYQMDPLINPKMYLDTIKLEGYDKYSDVVEFFGFYDLWGRWRLLDDSGEVIDPSIDPITKELTATNGILTIHEDPVTYVQWLTVNKKAEIPANGKTCRIQWVVNTEGENKATIRTNESPEGMSDAALEKIEALPVMIFVSNTFDLTEFKISGEYTGDYKETLNLNQVLDVDASAKVDSGLATVKINPPVFWEGSCVTENGDVTFPGPGTYSVRAYVYRKNGEKLYSNRIQLNAVARGLKSVDFSKPADLAEEDLLLTEKHPTRSIDLTDFVSYADQDGNAWTGDTEEVEKNMTFAVDDTENAEINGSVLTVSKAGTYVVSFATHYTYAGSDTAVKKNVRLTFTQEDRLDHIEMEEPSVSNKDLTLEEPGDQIIIRDLSELLRYYDQEGNAWTGKKPTVRFSVLPSTDNARIKGGDDFYADAPGTYKIQASASGYEISPVTVVVSEKSSPVVAIQDPPRLVLNEGEDSVSTDLDNCIFWTTQFGGSWKDALTEMNYSLDEGTKGAKIVTKAVKDSRTGQIRDENTIVCTKEGEYTVHVTPKKAVVGNYNITVDNDIIVKVDEYKKVASLKLEGLQDVIDDPSTGEVNSIENKGISVPLMSCVSFCDKNGNVIKYGAFPDVKFEVFERKKKAGAGGEVQEVVPDKEDAYIDDTDAGDPLLVANSPGQFVIRAKAMGDSDVKPAEANITLTDILWNHAFPTDKDGNHIWSYEEALGGKAPTCTESGIRVIKAEDGTVIRDQVPETGHHWSRTMQMWAEPTDTKAGVADIVCEKNCGIREGRNNEIVFQWGPHWTQVPTDNAGKKRFIFTEIPSESPFVEGENYHPPASWDGSWGAMTWKEQAGPATCTANGGYYFVFDDYEQKVSKRNIGFCRVFATGHHWSDTYTVYEAPTCDKEGKAHILCESCGKVRPDSDKSIPKLSHEYEKTKDGKIAYEVSKQPTCTEDGYKEAQCTRCSHVERVSMPALGHNMARPTYEWVHDDKTQMWSVTATRKCARDDCDYKETETVTATMEITRSATATSYGQTTYTAEFRNPAFVTQKTTKTDISPLEGESPEAADRKVLQIRKEEAKTGLSAYKADTDYEDAEKSARKEAVARGVNAIEKANTLEDVEQALADARKEIDAIPTAEKRADFRTKRDELIELVEGIDPTEISRDEEKDAQIVSAKENALAALNLSGDEAGLNDAVQSLAQSILQIMGKEEQNQETLGKVEQIVGTLKSNAYEELENYKKPADYDAEDQKTLAKIIADGKIAVDQAADSITYKATDAQIQAAMTAIRKAISDAETQMDQLQTAADKAAETLASYRTAATRSIIDYREVKNYRQSEQEQLRQIIAEAGLDIYRVNSTAEIDTIVKNAKAQLDQLKTDQELTAEELASFKQVSTDFVNGVDESGIDLTAAQVQILREAKAKALASIQGAATSEAVRKAVEEFADAVFGLYGEALTRVRNSAKEMLDGVDLSVYRAAQKAEAETAIAAGRTAIESAGTAEEVTEALNNALETIKAIPTDAKMSEEELPEAKKAAIETLNSYRNEADYRQVQKVELSAAIAKGTKGISKAANKDEVDQALTDAKAEIDMIKTDAQLSAEEQEELQKIKDEAVLQVNGYKSDVAFDPLAQVDQIRAAGITAIGEAKTKAEVDEAVVSVKAQIDLVPTRAQADLRAAADKCVEGLGAYQENDYDSNGWNTLLLIREAAVGEIQKATTVASVNAIYRQAILDINVIPTKAGTALANRKNDNDQQLAAHRAEESFRTTQKEKREELIAEYTEKIDLAADIDGADKALAEGIAAIDQLRSDDELTLEEKKEEALQVMKSYKDPSNYSEAKQGELYETLGLWAGYIENASTVEQVNTLLDHAKAALDQIDTLVKEVLKTRIAEAEAQLEARQNAINFADYREAEQKIIRLAISEGRQAISSAGSVKQVEACLNGTLNRIENVRTDAQLSAEELDETRENALSFVSSVNAKELSEKDPAAIEAAKTTAQQAIQNAAAEEEVDSALSAFLDRVAQIMTAEKEEQAQLVQARAEANQQLQAYLTEENLAKYRDGQKAEVRVAVLEAMQSVDQASALADVDQARTEALKTIGMIKTAAQMEQEESQSLSEAKTAAMAKLDAYAGQENLAKYRDDEKNRLMQTVEDAKDVIDSLTTKEAVSSALTQAEKTISRIKTDEQLGKEEQELAERTLAAARTKAKQALNSYRDPKDYRAEQKKELAEKIAAGETSIDAAATTDMVAAALEDARAEIDGILTDAQLTEQEDEFKSTKKTVLELIDGMGTEDFTDPEAKNKMTAAKNTALEAIGAAETQEALDEALMAFCDEAIAAYTMEAETVADEEARQNAEKQAAQLLAGAKENAVAELDQLVDKARYADADLDDVKAEVEAGKKAIAEAADIDAVNQAKSAVADKIASIPTRDQRNQEIKDAKKAAMKALSSKEEDLSAYRTKEQNAILRLIDQGIVDVFVAETQEEIKSAQDKTLKSIAGVKTDEELTKEEEQAAAKVLMDARDEAIRALEGYKDPNAYRDAQKKELEEAIGAAKNAINNAATAEAVEQALQAARKQINRIKTNAQLTAEEQKAAGGNGQKKQSGLTVGSTAVVGGTTVKVSSAAKRTVIIVKAANKKKVTIPATVKVKGIRCQVVGIRAGAFKASKAATVTIKTKKLTRKSVRNSLKRSKVRVIKVKVGKKKTNKKFIKRYKKIFTAKNAGKKVKVAA